jgi:hypothetical protein
MMHNHVPIETAHERLAIEKDFVIGIVNHRLMRNSGASSNPQTWRDPGLYE